ncbi:MAG: molybdopterin-dependent oxidoreductase [Myxococcales bacterium]|nr:molybdopterin-dependent oxidoreductase [Myxococcales bacterium]
MGGLTRREIIQLSGGGAAAAVVGSGLLTNWWGLDANQPMDPKTDGETVVGSICELCFWKCGINVHVKGGRVTKVEGNPKHPLSRGRLCPRGVGGPGLLYDPDRLKTPLIRVSERGTQRFREATWDEALDLIAKRFKEIAATHGPESIAMFQHGFGATWFVHLMKAFGTPNLAAPSYAQCKGPRTAAFNLTTGSHLGSPESVDIANSRCLTFLGYHLGENMHNTQVQDFSTALKNGGQLVVVDPRFSIAASKARHWLPIKPGTDIALLLAWINVIIEEKLYDRDFVAKYGHGFDELKKHVADKTPEWAWTQTTIPAAKIRETARFIAGFKPASLVHPGRHVTWYGDDTQRLRAVAILNGLLGNWGRKGGFILPTNIALEKVPTPTYPKPKRAVADRPRGKVIPLASAPLAAGVRDASIPGTADYDIKAWLVYGTNLPLSLPEPQKTREALQKLEFVVAIDVLPAEIVGWADVVLPESTYLERWDDLYNPTYEQPFVALRRPAVAPMYASKPGWWIAAELGKRLGLGAYFPWKSARQYVERRAKLSGLDFEALVRDGVIVGKRQPVTVEEGVALTFDTPSKKFEFYSDDLKKAGLDPLPVYTPHPEPPEGSYRLLFGRAPQHSFGRTANNRLLAETYAENEVWINADVCRSLGIKDKQRVVLVNQDQVKSLPVRVKATERIRNDCVYMVHGFGRREKKLRQAYGKGASDSELVTRSVQDPIMGGTGMNVNFVRIERA